MKLLILCVDGFDYDYAQEGGFDRLPYSAKLEIPRECYVPTPEGPTPHTVRVWPSMCSGNAIDYGLVVRTGLRKLAHDALVRLGATWKGAPRYRLSPSNEKMETVFTNRDAFLWNIPTISPEWITTFPSFDQFMAYCKQEFKQFAVLADGLLANSEWDVAAIYTRILDAYGHNYPDKIDKFYERFAFMAEKAADIQQNNGDHVMMLSDHGCLDGIHTDHAYLGATFPFEAKNIVDVREVIEKQLGLMNAKEWDEIDKEQQVIIDPADQKVIEDRLRRLGYIE